MTDAPLATLVDRLAYLIDAADLDRSGLSRLAGLSPTHVGQILRGAVRDPASSTIEAICRTLDISSDWLLSGKGERPGAAHLRDAAQRARAHVAATGTEG